MKRCISNPTAKPQTVATVTQLDSQKVLDPENLARKDNILVIYPNINNGYSVKPLAAIRVEEMVRFMNDSKAAFLLMEQKEPPAEEPTDPGTGDGGGTEPTEPENPGTGESGESTGSEGGTV